MINILKPGMDNGEELTGGGMKKRFINAEVLAVLMVFLLPVMVFAWPVPDTGH